MVVVVEATRALLMDCGTFNVCLVDANDVVAVVVLEISFVIKALQGKTNATDRTAASNDALGYFFGMAKSLSIIPVIIILFCPRRDCACCTEDGCESGSY